MIKINEQNQVNAKDIYSFAEVKTRFDMWLKRCIEYADLENGKDFCTVLTKSTGGRPATEYLFTIDAAKEVCIVSETKKAKELRRWLISLSNQVENATLVTHKQVLEVIKMVKIFSIYEFRKKALEKNLTHFIETNTFSNFENKFAKFHNWRNEVLHLGKEELEKRVLDYFIIEKRALPKLKNKDEMLAFIGEYTMIKNAVWDLLSSQEKSTELINNICNLSEEIAKEMKPYLQRLNENTLFFDKINENEIKSLIQ